MDKTINLIIFNSSPLNGLKYVDEDFSSEYNVAKKYFPVGLISFSSTDKTLSTHNIPKRLETTPILAMYRGWMLTDNEYESLYIQLKKMYNVELVNLPNSYNAVHYFPNVYQLISDFTPKTIYSTLDNIDTLLTFSKVEFNKQAVIIKDYVKSESAYYDTACYVPNGGDKVFLQKSINNLIQLRGDNLNKGIVIKQFVELDNDGKNTVEWRVYVLRKKTLGIFRRFDNMSIFLPQEVISDLLAHTIDILSEVSDFYTIDIVRTSMDEYIILEIGEGQVSDIPTNESDSFDVFYKNTRMF